MAHYFFTADCLIKNLTSEPVTSYNMSGDFSTFPPCQFEEDTIESMYIVDDEKYKELLKLGVDKKRIFFARHKGIGRDGKEVSMLLSKDGGIRLMPFGE